MTEAPLSSRPAAGPVPDAPAALREADRRLASAGRLVAQRVIHGPSRLIDDETMARVGGLLADLAAQALAGQEHDQATIRNLAAMLASEPAILLHCHALVIEWRLAAAARTDAVLPPILREALERGGEPDEVALIAPDVVAALTRVDQALGRMTLPWSELPGDLQHLALGLRNALLAEIGLDAGAIRPAAMGEGRLALLARLPGVMGARAPEALDWGRAGVALFLTAMALATGAPRELVTIATAEDDPVRLALLLRAAGLGRSAAIAQLLLIRPDADPALVDAVADRAAAEALLSAVEREA